MNFTNSTREIWGSYPRSHSMDSYFNMMIRGEGLIDVEHVNILPTWRNGRGNQEFVAKRFDHFLISEKWVNSGLKFITSVVNVKLSNHMPMVF